MTDISSVNSKPWYFQLHWQVLFALVVGVAFGWLMPSAAEGIGFVGDLFLRLLKMIIIPLIFTSLVSGVSSLGSARSVGRVGIRTGLYYTASTTLAIVVGMVSRQYHQARDSPQFCQRRRPSGGLFDDFVDPARVPAADGAGQRLGGHGRG